MVSHVEFFSEVQQDKDTTEWWVTLGSVFLQMQWKDVYLKANTREMGG